MAAQRGQDYAVEHFDRLHGELQLRVRKRGERERLRDGPEIDRAGLTLADACRVLLEAPASEPVADAVFPPGRAVPATGGGVADYETDEAVL